MKAVLSTHSFGSKQKRSLPDRLQSRSIDSEETGNERTARIQSCYSNMAAK